VLEKGLIRQENDCFATRKKDSGSIVSMGVNLFDVFDVIFFISSLV
jgi:hypothetical protein